MGNRSNTTKLSGRRHGRGVGSSQLGGGDHGPKVHPQRNPRLVADGPRRNEGLGRRQPAPLPGDDDEAGEDIEGLKAAIAALDARLDRLACPATASAPGRDVDSMTKAELQALADEHGIEGVDRTRQTRDQMLRIIRRAVRPSDG